jgi:hypothetical protein
VLTKPTRRSSKGNTLSIQQSATSTLHQPLTAITLPIHNRDVPVQLPNRNPFLFRTRLNFSLPFSISLFKLPKETVSSTPLEPLSHQPARRHSTWFDEEAQLFIPPSSTVATSASTSRQHNNGHDSSQIETHDSAIATLPPVLLPNSSSDQIVGQSQH